MKELIRARLECYDAFRDYELATEREAQGELLDAERAVDHVWILSSIYAIVFVTLGWGLFQVPCALVCLEAFTLGAQHAGAANQLPFKLGKPVAAPKSTAISATKSWFLPKQRDESPLDFVKRHRYLARFVPPKAPDEVIVK